ncbi:MAG: Ig-like domain repeat protein [Rhodanobacteraceae bacterium]|nr:Ig-like domain repeat protein [Rhodanobacteraceae bacterium]
MTESNNYASDSSCGFSNSGAASAPLGALTQAANGVYYYPLADGAAVDGGNGTFLPTETSLGLDVNGDGSIASAPINVDTRGAGFARVACGQVDLGAAERQNCAPTGVQLSPSSVPESAAIGSLVGTLSTIDPNLGDTHTYTFVSNPGNRFQISAGNQLRTAALLDYETASSHAITVRTTDAAGASFDAALTVTVLDVQHQVTPSAGSNGSLSPSTPQSVDHSATIAFTVTASPGYQIASVTGCGGSLAGSTYTTGAITAACTVSASFSLLPCATFVSPANGATNVAVAATLNWSLPGGATGASLSLGTDGGGLLPPSNLVNGAAMGTATSFDPMPDLQQGTIHYWRVVPANAFGAALNCPIWSFTTLTDADGDGIPDEIDTCPLIPDPSNADLDRPAGSVAHWGFNDGAGAVATDSLGGHDGTVTGAAWVSGQADGALSFDGSGDSVVVPHHPDLDFDTHDEMTLAMWLKLPANQVDASSNANPILDKLSGSVFPYSVFVRNQTHARSGEVELRQGDGTTTITLLSSVPINDNQWHHLAFVGDGDNLRAYVDGVLTNTIANTLSGSTSNTANVRIGARLTGTIDGITVVRRALAGYEIAALAASPPSADGVGNVCDVCPGLPDADQQDSDGDGLGDACDAVDLSLTVADVADPVLEGRSLGYTLAVTNAGPSAATDVVLSASVPAGTSFVSATGSGWPCSESAGTVTCLRATLAVGAAPTVTLALTAPADAGVNPSVQLAASVSSADVEAWPGDESATESTAIGPLPVVSIADAQILEGDSGVSNMLFTVTLSEPPVLPVEVIFETADGTAVLNEDYNTRDGTVSFAVGQTTGTAYVILKGDPLYELDETFSVVLQSFDLTNAVLGDATATGTILNDDPLVQRTLVVTGTGDAIANDGVCTLREAIRRANAPGWFVDDCGWGQPYLPGEPLTRDRIVFAIPDPLPIANELDKALSAVTGVGPIFTIHLGSALPAITDAVEIDGTTQPGADCTSWPPTLKVVLDGSALSGAEDGLAIGAADTIVRGLAIHSFPGDGVDISGSDVRLACNFIGTGANGSVDLGNGGAGVRISGSPVGVLVGTDGDGVGDVAERNLISGNDGGGVHVTGIGGAIAGNWIGPDSSGACGIGNATAGIIADSVELLVGADVDDPGGVEGNLIACNLAHGMVVSGAATDGLTARGNQIRDNAGAGVVVSGVPEDVNLDGNHVGGNAGAGVLVASDAHGVHLRRNRLDGNGGLGIDLVAAGAVADGVTANDTGDADTGANGLQNFPVLESALYTGSAVVVTGHLESTANADFVIEFFASDEADASGHGEGARFLGELAVSTDGSGHANVSTSLSGIAADEWLSATATDEDGNTSEFSAVRSLLIATTLSIDSDDPDPSTVGQAFEVQVSVASADPGTPATGSVAVSAAGAGNCVAVLANGSGACQLTGTSPGPTTIEASYAGNSSHAAASASAAHSIGLAASSTTITADTPDPSSFGEAVTVSVSVSSASGTPTGSVTIGDGLGTSCSAALSAGSGSCALTPAQGGALTLSAQYPGNGNFLASSDSEPHQVLAVASTLAILAHTPDPSVAGQPVNVSVLLSSGVGTPAGPVVVSDGAGASCQVAGASGNCNLIPTGIGSVPLDANFAGDANHLASSASSAHQIDRAGTATVAGAPFWPQFPAEPPRQFEPLRFPVAIDVLAPGAGTAGGTITVQAAVGAENCAIVLPANHCDLVPQTAGARDFAVSYSGDSHFLPSSASVQVQVLPDALFGSGFEQ